MGYCTNCGNEINGEKFCTKCGTRVSSISEPNVYVGGVDKFKKNTFGKLIIGIVIIGIIVAAFFLFAGRSYEALVKDYVDATIKGDAEKCVSLMPKSLIEYIADDEYDGDKEEMIFDLEEHLDNLVEQLEDYDVNVSDISYKITEVVDMDEDDIDDIEDEYRRAKLKIKEGKELKVELKIPIDGEERTESTYIDAVKIGRSWYIIGL